MKQIYLKTFVAISLVSCFGCQNEHFSSTKAPKDSEIRPEVKALQAKLAHQTSKRLGLYVAVHSASQAEDLAANMSGDPLAVTPVAVEAKEVSSKTTSVTKDTKTDAKKARHNDRHNDRPGARNKSFPAKAARARVNHLRSAIGSNESVSTPPKDPVVKSSVSSKAKSERSSGLDLANVVEVSDMIKATAGRRASTSVVSGEESRKRIASKVSPSKPDLSFKEGEGSQNVAHADKGVDNQLKWLASHHARKASNSESHADNPAPSYSSPTIGNGGTSLTASSINSTLRRHQGSLQVCYERALKRNPTLGGKLGLSMTIAGSGRVTVVTVSKNSFSDSAVVNCMTAQARKWQFPLASAPVTINKTFVFMPQS